MRVLRRRIVIITLFGFAVVPVGVAHAGATDDTRDPWATVNVCDTAGAPDTIGIRVSMPGVRAGSDEQRYARLVVQYFSREDSRWYRVAEGGDSGYLSAGTGKKARQLGRSFRIEPMPGEPVLLRGKVTFQWRVKGQGVVRSSSVLTRKGHRSSAGDDPPGYSAATCTVTA
jgi:hypothetical protein